MIDLIIPYYDNPEGLERTLNSIDQNIFYITIVDDNSNLTIRNPKARQVFRSNINRGPGYARQLGIEKTHNEYLMFLDTGDIFISLEVQQSILDTIISNPELNFISFPYFHFGKLTDKNDNRLHGKIYKRSFLEKYNIIFPLESSYLNEDIGFNRICRLCTDMTFIPTPVIDQIKDINSLTQKDNQITSYRDQTRALSLITIHTVETCRKYNIQVQEEINQVAMSLYYWFIKTAAERPEFMQEAWSGAKIFYDKFKNEINPEILPLGNHKMKQCLKYQDKIKFSINLLRFTHDILENEIIPDYYLTKI